MIINSSKDSIIEIPKGITYETPLNSPVYATDNGVVSEIKFLEGKYEGRKGVSLRIRHKKGLESEYVEIDNIVVKYGEKVVKDQIIGYTANKEFFFQFVNNGNPMDPPSYFFEQEKSIINTY